MAAEAEKGSTSMVRGTVDTVAEAGDAHRTCVALTKDAGVAASPPNLVRVRVTVRVRVRVRVRAKLTIS